LGPTGANEICLPVLTGSESLEYYPHTLTQTFFQKTKRKVHSSVLAVLKSMFATSIQDLNSTKENVSRSLSEHPLERFGRERKDTW
jgi:hypothetical protein